MMALGVRQTGRLLQWSKPSRRVPGLTGRRLANGLVASGGRDATGDTGFLTLNPVPVKHHEAPWPRRGDAFPLSATGGQSAQGQDPLSPSITKQSLVEQGFPKNWSRTDLHLLTNSFVSG